MVNTSAVPPVAGLSNSSQTAYVNNYDPRPGPDQSDRQWWVVDVGFKDYLDESLALSDALPYGYDYIPGSAAIADYTWGGTSGTYSFTPLPDGGATTIDNSTVGSACTPADPSTPARVNSGGQTLRWNFSRGAAAPLNGPWTDWGTLARGDQRSVTSGGVPATITAATTTITSHVRIVYATRNQKATQDCWPQLIAPTDALANLDFVNTASVTASTPGGPAALSASGSVSRSMAVRQPRAVFIDHRVADGSTTAGATSGFDVRMSYDLFSRFNSESVRKATLREVINDWDPTTGTHLYVPGTATAKMNYLTTLSLCGEAPSGFATFPLPEASMFHDPTDCSKLVEDALRLDETIVSRTLGGPTVVEWRFPDTVDGPTEPWTPGSIEQAGWVACALVPQYENDGVTPKRFADGTPRSVIGSRDLCARQATVHIPLPVPQTTPDGQVFSSSAIFDNDEFMMAQHNTLPPELLGNWPVSNSYNWFGYLTANDDATLTVRNGSPAPLPTKVGPATARIGDVVSWTITVPLPAGTTTTTSATATCFRRRWSSYPPMLRRVRRPRAPTARPMSVARRSRPCRQPTVRQRSGGGSATFNVPPKTARSRSGSGPVCVRPPPSGPT